MALRVLPDDAVYTVLSSPVGELRLVGSKEGLHALVWEQDLKDAECRQLFAHMGRDDAHPTLQKTVAQLEQYFAGKRQDFDLPLAPLGTPFQLKAWNELQRIPFGKTISYAEQAQRMGDRKKARAVGTANSRNPLSIIIPCHRVIASSGLLSGFGGGVSIKEFLLRHERALQD